MYILSKRAHSALQNRKVGVGAIACQAAEQVLQRGVADEATAPYHSVG
ncbi:hypothetical protein [Spirosoma sp. KUDC1026]|nr:hypothetical protein [Spirosoma sp. KUDC1026]QKZ13815.1 hypothetical protein HU175_14715 [Spirosoma sp. KUDC1026]